MYKCEYVCFKKEAGKDNSRENFCVNNKGLLLQVLTERHIKVLTCVTQHFLNKGNFEGHSICFSLAKARAAVIKSSKKKQC